jgi:high-affinity Fe2+/Pb2+ permease
MAIQTNGKPQRKQLSDQLDRFDTMLDGLSEALNVTIADAVRDGTRLALKDAVVEILTDPTLRSKLREATDPVKPSAEPMKRSSFWEAAKARVAATSRALKTAGAMAASSAVSGVKTFVDAVRNPTNITALASTLKRLVWVGASAGIVIAVVSYFAPHTISAALSGLTAAVAAISILANNWTRRALQTVAT